MPPPLTCVRSEHARTCAAWPAEVTPIVAHAQPPLTYAQLQLALAAADALGDEPRCFDEHLRQLDELENRPDIAQRDGPPDRHETADAICAVTKELIDVWAPSQWPSDMRQSGTTPADTLLPQDPPRTTRTVRRHRGVDIRRGRRGSGAR